ncbi:MAG: hypothetical protein ACI9UQ_000742 [Candidatus Krumholzibacteriia bacterium]|jgi:hypothetical protein
MTNSIDDLKGRRNYPMSRSVFIFLVVLSLGGVAIMDYSVKYGLLYWVAMSVVSGGISVGLAWRHAAESGESAKGHFGRQAFHWLTLIAGLLLVFFLQNAETLAAETSGLMALLMLALTTTLAGVHFHPRLALLGGIQAATFVAAVLTEEFFWILLILILLVVIADILLRSRGKVAQN